MVLLFLGSVFQPRIILIFRGYMMITRNIFCLSQLGDATGIYWIGTRDVAQHLMQDSPTTRNYVVHNVKNTKVDFVLKELI